MKKPVDGEFNPAMQHYIDLITEGQTLEVLKKNAEEIYNCFENIPENKHNYRYAEGKWTIKEMLMHITDTERVMSYRAFVAGRCDDKTNLYYMDEDAYAANVNVNERSLKDILEEFKFIRGATIKFYESLDPVKSTFKAKNMDFNVTAGAMLYIICGHAKHHMNVLKERYLN